MTPPSGGYWPFCSSYGFRSRFLNCSGVSYIGKHLTVKPTGLTRRPVTCQLFPTDSRVCCCISTIKTCDFKSPDKLRPTSSGGRCCSVFCMLLRWGVISHSPTLGRHLGFPVTLLVCLCTQAQSGHSGIAWCAWGNRLYLPWPRVWWLRANTWYLSKAVKAPFSSLPCMASRQTPTELFTCQFWKVSAKISSDRCKWMGAFLAFLCRDGSYHLDHLVCPYLHCPLSWLLFSSSDPLSGHIYLYGQV